MKLNRTYPRTKSAAFSLIQLLVAITVIAVMAAIALSAIGPVRDRASQVHCVANLRQVGAAILLYVGDHEGRLPGPTNVRIESSYREGEQRLAAQIGPYLSYQDPAAASTRVHVAQLRCPTRAFDPNNEATFIAQCRMGRLSNGTMSGSGRPFGRKTGGSAGQDIPILFSELGNHGGPARVWSIMEADQQIPWANISNAWKDKLPPAPPHGNRRTTLYFDGHVALLSELPK